MCFSVKDQKEGYQVINLTGFSVDHSLNPTLQKLYRTYIHVLVKYLVITFRQQILPGVLPRVCVHSSVVEEHETYTVKLTIHCGHQVFKSTLYDISLLSE